MHDPEERARGAKLRTAIAAAKERAKEKGTVLTLKIAGCPVRRNDRCPCGSGKKFKICCLPELR